MHSSSFINVEHLILSIVQSIVESCAPRLGAAARGVSHRCSKSSGGYLSLKTERLSNPARHSHSNRLTRNMKAHYPILGGAGIHTHTIHHSCCPALLHPSSPPPNRPSLERRRSMRRSGGVVGCFISISKRFRIDL